MRRPLLVYDADCEFCRRWVERWRARTGDAIRYRPLQQRAPLVRLGVTRAAATRAIQLIEPGGQRAEGAEAVFRVLARDPRLRWVARLGRLPGVRAAAALAYRLVARHRRAASRLDRLLFGRAVAPTERRLVRWLFLRALGVTYLVAFWSLERQVLGLYGQRGISPIRPQLDAWRARIGRDAYRLAPSLLWLGATDRDLVRLCQAGEACAAALALGVAPRVAALACWAFYLSFVATGGEFLSYQWDVLLLEAGLQGALDAPLLLRWLVVRLHFQSGLAKLRSYDATWRALTACAYHYETQPLPTPLGWYAHHLPRPLQRLSTAVALGIELGAPGLGLGPRRARRAAFALLAGLQALIAATGNFAFFNLLSVALALWLLDDETLRRLPALRPLRDARPRALRPWRRAAGAAVWAAPAAASLSAFLAGVRERPLPAPLERLMARLAPLRSFNTYGLFSVMTTSRPEIVVEGSDDGQTWRAYAFRYKPSQPGDRPRWAAPHQPRLDWQMWFAALGPPPRWFTRFLRRLLEGSPEVLALLRANPFPAHPPRFVRAQLYDLRATDLATRRRTGAWWRRELVGTYVPAVTL